MSEEEHAESREAVHRRNPLFNVVHDPLTDRFFLQEIEEHEADAVTRGNQAAGKSVGATTSSAPSFPWEQVVLPPRSVSKSKAAARNVACSASSSVSGTTESPSSSSVNAVTLTAATAPDPTDEVDVAASSTQGATNTCIAASEPSAGPSLASPTRRSRWGNNRAARTAKLPDNMAALLLSLPEHGVTTKGTQTAIKWSGEPVSVRVVGLAAADPGSNNETHERSEDDLDPRVALSPDRSTERDHGQWLARTFDLQQLSRIRPSADGFRDRSVNIGCTFTPMDPWSFESDIDEAEERRRKRTPYHRRMRATCRSSSAAIACSSAFQVRSAR